jgi:hypothetical protein
VSICGRRGARGRTAGLFAALFPGADAQFFFQAHLACFDVPIVTMWTLTAYAYWESLHLRRRWVWPVLTGIAFVRAGAATYQAQRVVSASFVVVAHIVGRRRLIHQLDARRPYNVIEPRFGPSRLRSLTALGAMALFGPIISSRSGRASGDTRSLGSGGYASFHLEPQVLQHGFLGKNYWAPPMPRGYAWVMTATTVPSITLLLFFVGLAAQAGAALGVDRRDAWRPLSGDRASGPVSRPTSIRAPPICCGYSASSSTTRRGPSPNTPIFGGTEALDDGYPFLALFAGCCGFMVARALQRRAVTPPNRRFAWAPGGGAPGAASDGSGRPRPVIAAPLVRRYARTPGASSRRTRLSRGARPALRLGSIAAGFTTGAIVPDLSGSRARGVAASTTTAQIPRGTTCSPPTGGCGATSAACGPWQARTSRSPPRGSTCAGKVPGLGWPCGTVRPTRSSAGSTACR